MEPKLFGLYRLLLKVYGDSEQFDREVSNPERVRYDEETRTYLFREDEDASWEDARKLTQRSMRLVLSEETEDDGRSWFNLVLSGPEQEFPFSGGARLRILMNPGGETDEKLEAVLSGCREFARVNPHFPVLPEVPSETEDAFFASLEADPARAGENLEAVRLVRELEEEKRNERRKNLRRIKEEPVTIAVIDTEMAEHHIIQFSGLLLQQKSPAKFAVIQTKNIYLQLPERVHISEGVRNLTHISESMLARKGLARQYAGEKEIKPFLEKADIICGHAVLNDTEALKKDFPEVMKELSGRRREGSPFPDPGFLLADTQRMSDAVFRLKKTASLEECCSLAGIAAEEGEFHDALVDARMTAKLFLKLLYPYMKRLGRSPAEPGERFGKSRGLVWLNPIRDLDEGDPGED